MTALASLDIDGVGVHRLGPDGIIAEMHRALTCGQGGWLATVNLQYLALARRDAAFLQLLQGAELRCADGVPLLWAGRLAGQPIPGRVNGTDLLPRLAGLCAALGRPIGLVGGRPGAAAATAAALARAVPGLVANPVLCPAVGFSADAQAQQEVLAALAQAQPAVVLVAMGCPVQDRLCSEWRSRLPQTWLVGIGGSFELVAGMTPRAPGWMRSAGMEWVHRLGTEPSRLARRYLVECLPYGIGMLWRMRVNRRR